MPSGVPLLVTSGFVHPGPIAQMGVYRLLRQCTDLTVRRERGLGVLERLEAARCPLCATYFHHPEDASGLVDGLDRYVREGGSLLAFHSVSASFKGNVKFEALMGGVFTRHGPVCRLSIACEGADEIDEVVDEPYEHRISGEVDTVCTWRRAEVPGNAGARAGAHEATSGVAAWTRRVGAGRVAYLALGHRGSVWRSPGVAAIVQRIVDWCTGGAN
jgi:hypothetical protein